MAVVKLHPTAKKAHDDAKAFFSTIGQCITAWAFVDRQIYKLFVRLLRINPALAAVLYYQWRTLDNRLNVVDKLVKHSVPESVFLKQWRPIKNAIDDLLEVRAIIAHQPPLRTGYSTKSGRAAYRYSLHVEPAERHAKKGHRGLKGKEEISRTDLMRHLRRVERVPKKLAEFRALLIAPPAQRKRGS
jgi:hypothetical protein